MGRSLPGSGSEGVGQEPGFDARMGHSNRGRILRQYGVASTLQLPELTRVISLGVDDKDKSGRTAVDGLMFRKPDLLRDCRNVTGSFFAPEGAQVNSQWASAPGNFARPVRGGFFAPWGRGLIAEWAPAPGTIFGVGTDRQSRGSRPWL